MTRTLVTGSAQGIGAEVARALVALGHEVVVHGRDAARARVALEAVPGAAGVVVGGLDTLAGTRAVAADAVAQGPFDVIVHNAAVTPHRDERTVSEDGLEVSIQVNAVAPYLLTCLVPLPSRLVYVGSDASDHGAWNLADFGWTERPWDRWQAYNDSKLYVAMLALEAAARYPGTISTVVHPGWVQTAMGGPGAQIPVAAGADSIVWLASSDEPRAVVTGRFIDTRAERALNPLALDPSLRSELMAKFAEVTGADLP